MRRRVGYVHATPQAAKGKRKNCVSSTPTSACERPSPTANESRCSERPAATRRTTSILVAGSNRLRQKLSLVASPRRRAAAEPISAGFPTPGNEAPDQKSGVRKWAATYRAKGFALARIKPGEETPT